jgi:hypothetical protein
MDSEYISTEESSKVTRLLASGIVDCSLMLTELGLMVNFALGEYCIMDHKQWMLGKIKYGI